MLSHSTLTVGMFQWYLPHYRTGVLNAISRYPNFTVTVLAPTTFGAAPDLNLMEHGLTCARIPIISWRLPIPFTNHRLTFQPRAIWSMVRGEYDVLVQANDLLGLDVWVNVILSRVLGRPVCLWGHGFSKGHNTGIRPRLRRLLMSWASAVIFYTPGVRDRWIDQGLAAEKAFVAPNTLDTDRIAAARAHVTAHQCADNARQAGLDGKKLIVYIGRLLPEKRPVMILDTLERLVPKCEHVHAVFIGDGPMRQTLERDADARGLRQHVTFLGAIHDEELIAPVLERAAVVILPTAAGLSIQHAFAYGVPVIISDSPSTNGPEEELVQHDVTGYRCRENNLGDFVAHASRLLDRPADRDRLSRNCELLIQDTYNVQRMAAGILQAVQHSLASSRRRHPAKE